MDRVIGQVAVAELAKVPLQLVSGELTERLRQTGVQVPGHLLPVPLDRAWASAHRPELQQPLPHQGLEAEVVGRVMASGLSLTRRRLLPVIVDRDAGRHVQAGPAADVAQSQARPPGARLRYPNGF